MIKGESGSGKTTLFRLMLGFEQPDDGNILYKNKSLDLDTIKKLRKESSWLPQDLNLGSGKVRELIQFPFDFKANNGARPSQEALITVFEQLGLEASLLENPFADLSTGQRQRAGIALCYLLKKKLIFLDEPTSALDRESKKKVADLLFKDKDRTIISTSHDPFWVDQCNNIVELN